MKILIVDGQGGGVGRSLTEAIIKKMPDAEIIIVGTNSIATSNMIKGFNVDAATGENPVVFNSSKADVITGPMGIIMANAMHGEITPKMAEAISSSNAKIVLIPMNKCHANVVGIENKKLSEYINQAVEFILDLNSNK